MREWTSASLFAIRGHLNGQPESQTAMQQWIAANFQVLSLAISTCSVLVWVVYLQVYVRAYRRQRRFKILINRSHGRGLKTSCLVSNMSSEAIYVQSLVAVVESPDNRWECPLTDLSTLNEHESAHSGAGSLPTRQGPLAAGAVRNMGTYKSLIEHVLMYNTDHPVEPTDEVYESLTSFEVTVLGVYASEDLMVGARRKFDLKHTDGKSELIAQTITAEQIRSKRERRALTTLLVKEL